MWMTNLLVHVADLGSWLWHSCYPIVMRSTNLRNKGSIMGIIKLGEASKHIILLNTWMCLSLLYVSSFDFVLS